MSGWLPLTKPTLCWTAGARAEEAQRHDSAPAQRIAGSTHGANFEVPERPRARQRFNAAAHGGVRFHAGWRGAIGESPRLCPGRQAARAGYKPPNTETEVLNGHARQ